VVVVDDVVEVEVEVDDVVVTVVGASSAWLSGAARMRGAVAVATTITAVRTNAADFRRAG
jgi:hypothetical protein